MCARAEEGIVLRERAALRPGLCGALRIQLSGVAEVRCERDSKSDELSARLSSAAVRVGELSARLAVLLERDPDPGRVRMYIVSARGDQAVIAIERIEDRPEPDVDRSLALKVRDAFELVGAVREVAANSPTPLVAAVALPPPEPAPPPAPTEPARSQRTAGERTLGFLFLDAGGGLTLGQQTRATAALALGIARVAPRSRLELGAGVRFGSPQEQRRSFGAARVRERGPLLTLRAGMRRGRLEVGGVLDAMLSITSAEGVSADGSRGARTLLIPTLGLGLDLRVRLFSSVLLRVAPTLELPLVAMRYAVEERVLVDDGRARVLLPLSLVIALPLRAAPESVQP